MVERIVPNLAADTDNADFFRVICISPCQSAILTVRIARSVSPLSPRPDSRDSDLSEQQGEEIAQQCQVFDGSASADFLNLCNP